MNVTASSYGEPADPQAREMTTPFGLAVECHGELRWSMRTVRAMIAGEGCR